MNRLLLIAALLAIVTVTFVPAFDVIVPHHDDAATSHAAQDDNCGCVCHVSVDAVVVAETMEIYLIAIPVENPYDHSKLDPLYNSLDRPPELFS
jgi:hypothetical protein